MNTIPEFTKKLLVARGIKEGDYERFLHPLYEHLHDPFLMKGMELACVRLFEAIDAKEKICVYSDYDCDGIPGAVLVTDILREVGADFVVYIPEREDEGYGFHEVAVRKLIADGVTLFVTIDVGTANHDTVAYAEANGANVIICDHHISPTVPHAYAVLNPQQPGETYPEKILSGAGVAFKFMCGFIKKYGEYYKIADGREKWLLDMAGLATIADQVPLVGENRVLATFGLKVLRKTKRLGLRALLLKNRVDIETLTEEDVGFTIAPRLNAASRMDSPMVAYKLLSTQDPKEATELASYLTELNNKRKTLSSVMAREANKKISERDGDGPIVIGNPEWRLGMLGLIASRVAEHHKRPTFVWTRTKNGVIKGSCRTDGTTNVYELMKLLPEGTFIEFGGHAPAGGFSMEGEKIHFLESLLAKALVGAPVLAPEEKEMLPLDLALLSKKFYEELSMLAPFGEGNPKPLFSVSGARIKERKMFGKEKEHIEVVIESAGSNPCKCISFFREPEEIKGLGTGDVFPAIAVSVEHSTFGYKSEIRLRM